ncbi:MAG: AraC family transcriptional regulator [Eubacteriales bacterium]|nr:AraC family transcriptional regulator [Eubacteriales bacterium]
MPKAPAPAPERREGVRHGDAFFPVEKYSTVLSKKVPPLTVHWHEEAEWTLVTAGRGFYQIDLVEYPVCAGDLLLIPPLQLHAARCGPEDALETETFVFHLNFLGSNAADVCAARYLSPLARQELSVPCHLPPSHPAYPAMARLFERVSGLFAEKAPGYELSMKACLLEALAQLLPYSQRLPAAGAISQKLKQVLDYLSAHYTEDISVAQLAALCYFSEYHFMRFFKKHMNMTCVEYITTLRLEKAVEQLKTGEGTILDAALSAGFHNLAYFYKVFKRKYQMTPREFIRQLGEVP